MDGMSYGSGAGPSSSASVPILLHFDVNKTVIQSDSIKSKTIEEGIREGIAELFWGSTRKVEDENPVEEAASSTDGAIAKAEEKASSQGTAPVAQKVALSWDWARGKPSCCPPAAESPDNQLVTYAQYCKLICTDKEVRKEAVQSFKYCNDEEAKREMDKLLQASLMKMRLPPEVRYTPQAEKAGLNGCMHLMFPSVFHFVASLQRQKRQFGILFRSFGADHEAIKCEWNAFCDMTHPIFSKLIQGVGPMNGTAPGVPDRRIHSLHTLYRDAQGPVLIIDTYTNGPESSWDKWAKQKPKAKSDTRGGREFIHKVLKSETAEGYSSIQSWMKQHLAAQKTAAIKDDWAWWQWNGEKSEYGKLLTILPGAGENEQLFFDDNIELNSARIVDVRGTAGEPLDFSQVANKICTKVNPVEALLDNDYYLRKLQQCKYGGNSADTFSSFVDFQRQLTEVEDQKANLDREVSALRQQLKNLSEENWRMKLLHRLTVRDEAHLADLVEQDYGKDVMNEFGKDAKRSLSDLYKEIAEGHCWLQHQGSEGGGESKLARVFEMVFIKIHYKGMILLESHEQDDAGHILNRNYLPGLRKALKSTSFDEALNNWFEKGLNVNIQKLISAENLPVYTPEAPRQQTHATEAYPIDCRVQMSEASYVIAERAVETHKDLLQKIGLPAGQHFTTTEPDLHGGNVTRIWRWEKLTTWEATAGQMSKGIVTGAQVDISEVCNKLFKDHERREVYERLLMLMFESFTAKKLCGGFSGSIVIRVQPFESDGRPGEACIVKLDDGGAIRQEAMNSRNVFEALPDRAARIIGDAVYANDSRDGHEFGAMRLELAGACWNVPELAQGSANLLSTFKDLLLYESEQGTNANAAGDARPFGNVNSVLAETFGTGGIVSSLRKGGRGLRRHDETPLPWGWYTLKGKKSNFNPYTAGDKYPPGNVMREMYKKYFKRDMPNLMSLVDNIKPKLERLAAFSKKELFPLVALAHGDLNAANIMIDALDAVWLIDFATSVDLPLFTDMCKFELACLFEYASIPLTPKMLMDFATDREDMWKELRVTEWIRVDNEEAGFLFLRELSNMSQKELILMSQAELDELIERVASKSEKHLHKQRAIVRALSARLTASEDDAEKCITYCAECSKVLLEGDYILETLNLGPLPELQSRSAMSLKFFMEIVAGVRRFMIRDINTCLREYNSQGLELCDASSLQLYLPFLRETYRIIGYRDIPPQHKIWSIYHCDLVIGQVNKILEEFDSNVSSLASLPIMSRLNNDLLSRIVQKPAEKEETSSRREAFSESDSLWIFDKRDAYPPNSNQDKIVRRAHSLCATYQHRAGFFAPTYQVLAGDNTPIPLSFDNQCPDKLPWTLHMLEDEDDIGSRCSEDLSSLLDPELSNGILGVMGPGDSGKPCQVMLRSRIFFLTLQLLLRKNMQIHANSIVDQRPHMDESFIFSEWSHGLFDNSSELVDKQAASREKKRVFATIGSHQILLPEVFYKFLTLEAVARDAHGKEMMRVFLILGNAVLCYPPGAHLCLEDPRDMVFKNPEVTVMQLHESGVYHIRNSDKPERETEREFEPCCGNHTFLTPCRYKEKQRVIMAEEHNSWVDAEVIESASEETGWRYRLSITEGVAKANSWGCAEHLAEEAATPLPTTGQVAQLYHLSSMSSGAWQLLAANYEEEVHKMKAYFRARCSCLIDSLSGRPLDVKSMAMPTLHIVRGPGAFTGNVDTIVDEPVQGQAKKDPAAYTSNNGQRTSSLCRKLTLTSQSTSVGPASTSPQPQDPQQGWQVITTAIERYNRAQPSCSPNAFLVLGSPGSGKTALVHRLMMDCLDRQRDLVPVLLNIADIVKRTDKDEMKDTFSDKDSVSDDSSRQGHAWFDKYLRIFFGDESQRYKMVRQAMSMHRVLFLFEGLEDVGALQQVVERLIRDIVLDRHLVVITSRPLLQGTSSLEGMSEYMISMTLQHLTLEQMRSVAHTRLGLEGLRSFDDFHKRLQQGQGQGLVSDLGGQQEDDTGEAGQEDVFGNPMMLSMLICYLQPDKDGNKDKPHKDNEGEGVTLTAVYRVAIDVMLQRVQSKQQAERHRKEEKVAMCKRILEKMAMAMQVQKRVQIEAEELERILPPQLRPEWKVLKAAVEAGHAMFLRTQKDGDRLELRFLVKGFQNFFAASDINTDGGLSLPSLVPLLTESWWAQMIEMLAEAWPHKYVKVIENNMSSFDEDFEAERGNTFLHLAAQVGHRPVFKLLHSFSDANKQALWVRNKNRGHTPLHVAAEKGYAQLCALMLEHVGPASNKQLLEVEDMAERLPMHVALQQGHFTTAKFLLDRWNEAASRQMSKHGRRATKENAAEKLASKILDLGSATEPRMTEQEFKIAAAQTFVELSYFSNVGKLELVEKQREFGALLAVFWICANLYEKFVRGQTAENCLTKASWENLQDWTRKTVGLTRSPATVGAMLVFTAVMSVGKIKALQRAFAPKYDDDKEALASILQNDPILIPSFQKLDVELQHMLLSALKADFNFGQFLQAENLPASLLMVKDILGEGGENAKAQLGFFLFRIFVAMCGILGMKSLEGSSFMTEKMYNNFKIGMDVLDNLTEESAQEVYNRFLAERSKAQGLLFDALNKESRAKVRLACLSRTFEPSSGNEVSEAFDAMDPDHRAQLTDYLNADGITQKGFLLFNSPLFLENARRNSTIGLMAAFRMLLKVYQEAGREYRQSETLVVTIMMNDLADHAKTCVDPEVFEFTQFEISRTAGSKSESQGSVKLSPWQILNDKEALQSLSEETENLLQDVMIKDMREPLFLRQLLVVFPEMRFFASEDDSAQAVLRYQARAALLVVYWVASNLYDAFTRGQGNDEKMSEKSWSTLQRWVDNMDESILNMVFVAVVAHAVAGIPKFRSQLAPNANNHHETLAHVMETCPKVLPSYFRLEPECRKLVKDCITREFSFESFLRAENLPGSLTALKSMLQAHKDDEKGSYLNVFVLTIFAIMSGSQGAESLEGSLFMTEERWLKFRVGMDAIMLLQEGKSEREVFDKLLQAKAEACGLNLRTMEERAVCRLACLVDVCGAEETAELTSSWEALELRDRAELAKHLNVDGIRERPGFVLQDSPGFLESARANTAVGLTPGMQILLKVYQSAEKKFQDSDSVITIQLSKLKAFATEFFGSVAFQDMSFELERVTHNEALVIPKVWIPVQNEDVLNSLNEKATALCEEVLRHKLTEDQFKARIGRIFPELSYFTKVAVQRDQTLGAMLSVFWLISNQYESFIRGQKNELSKQSWAWIQDWMTHTVKLTPSDAPDKSEQVDPRLVEQVDAMLVFMAIHALGKNPQFREELMPGYEDQMHDVALAHILESNPYVVPSFHRLETKYKTLIVDSLSIDFQFSQFLQAETTPSNLGVMKDRLKEHGADGFAFFTFRIFAQMCGKDGSKSLKGSHFMNEAQFQRFRPGLDALQQLRSLDAVSAYNGFLLLRGSNAMSRFASPEHQALARLLCLGSAYDVHGGQSICDAFDELKPVERSQLTSWLNSDGISQAGFTLSHAAALLQNAKMNRAVGLPAALRMLLKVKEKCISHEPNPSGRKVVVNLKQIADWAKDAGPDPTDFLQASVWQRCEIQGEMELISVNVRPCRSATTVSDQPRSVEPFNTSQETVEESEPSNRPIRVSLPLMPCLAFLSILFFILALVLPSAPLGPELVVLALILSLASAVGCYFRYRMSQGDSRTAEDGIELPSLSLPRLELCEPLLRFADTWNTTPGRHWSRGHDYTPIHQTDEDIA